MTEVIRGDIVTGIQFRLGKQIVLERDRDCASLHDLLSDKPGEEAIHPIGDRDSINAIGSVVDHWDERTIQFAFERGKKQVGL